MLLIYPPVAKPGEAPAGITRLAGTLKGHGVPCAMLDANLEGQLFLLTTPAAAPDTWTRRARRHLPANLAGLRLLKTYENVDRYRRTVSDLNRIMEVAGRARRLSLTLVNYEDEAQSPVNSADLLRAAEQHADNIFYPYFSQRLSRLILEKSPRLAGFSLCYLSQALCTFAMIGFLKKRFPSLPIVLGGGLVTSWCRNPAWSNPFAGLVDHIIAGPGEQPLLELLGSKFSADHPPSLTDLPISDYLSPGFVLPYAASSGCYWKRCSFCPEKAEANPYQPKTAARVLQDINAVRADSAPVLLHFLDNAISPGLFRALMANPPGVSWYGFARFTAELAEPDFCLALRGSGCVMLKLGLESGDQGVLDRLGKGIDLTTVSLALQALKKAGIATYVYLLFGTPPESAGEARRTLEYVSANQEGIGFLNLAVFNMPLCGPDAGPIQKNDFYGGDLSLYTDFIHPGGWGRKEVRRFLDHEFKRHPAIAPILRRDPPLFTSGHAPFFTKLGKPR